MQEDANRGVPHGKGRPVTNASTASANDRDQGRTMQWIAVAGGLVVLALLTAMLTA